MAIDSEHAVAVLLELFANGVKGDLITLVAGSGGQSVPIHRSILMANSKYFAASLGPNFKEANENEFVLDETDGPTLKAIVDFCYAGLIDLTEENVPKYLAIASSVELHLLESKCFRFISNQLDMSNAVETLVIADKYSKPELRQKSLDLVCGLFAKLPESHIDELDYRLLKEIMKSDAVEAEEQFIFERLLSWFGKDEDKRGQHMVELLKLMRLPLIPPQFLNSDMIQKVYKKFDCVELLYADCRRRIVDPTANARTRRNISISCLFKQFEGEDGAQQSAVKIEQYNGTLNEFEEIGEIELGQRKHFEAILHGSEVYVLGGQVNGVTVKSMSAFDLSTGKERVLPEMATTRYTFTSILLGKFIYVFGGIYSNGGTLNNCERFDLETETWKTLKPMNCARSRPGVAVRNGYIYVAGGYNPQTGTLKNVELFDPQNDEWITLSSMNDARSDFALSPSKRYLYAMGHSSSIERYDPWKTRWTKIDSIKSCKEITSSVVVGDNIYFIDKEGKFSGIEIGGNDGGSFIPLGKSKFTAGSKLRHFLSHN